ncbi:hypothetical protein ES708_09577 [subsurface metagenome]
MKKFDIIIVGAGAAGSIAAYFGAKKGYCVCLLDGKTREKIGDKICGDGIGKQIFDTLNIPHPTKGEYLNIIEGIKIYPPDTGYTTTIKDTNKSGYIIDRLAFGQRLVNDAIKAGASLYDQTHAISLIKAKDQIIGVFIKSKTIEEQELYGNLIIDASGFNTRLRKQVDTPHIAKKIAHNDYIICYREILRFKNPVALDNKYVSLYLDKIRAPGGFIWYFPRNEYEVNLGIGIANKHKSKLKEYYQKYVHNPLIGDEPHTKISSGSGLVSVCKPLWNGVGNGIIFAGDAAMQVNPMTGGGLVPSMQAGFYAIQAYEVAERLDKYDARSLWGYNILYQKSMGAEFAALDLFRLALQGLPNDILDFIIKKRLITGEEISKMTSFGETKLQFSSIISKMIRGISRPKILLDLIYLMGQMKKIKSHYMNYPQSPQNLAQWIDLTQKIYEKIHKRFRLIADPIHLQGKKKK